MSDLYLDEIEKIKYYKQRIADKLLAYGKAADKEKIQQELDQIDLKLAVFSQGYIHSGSTLSVDQFNEQKMDIYEDLKILYTLLYRMAQDRIEKARVRIRYELDGLRTQAKRFQYLVDAQTVSVYGKTIFRQTSNFFQEYNDGQVIIDLGPVSACSGSYLAPMIASDEFDPEDVTFIFQAADGTEIRTAAYNYAKNYVRILGNYSLSSVTYPYRDKVFGKELIHTDDTPNASDQYNLFLNKNQIGRIDLETNNFSYAQKDHSIWYRMNGREEVSFYVYGASFLRFSFAGEPEYKNFTGNEIVSPRQRQKIILRGDGISFDIDTDGTIYAEKVPATIQQDQLSIGENFTDITDYTVEHIQYGEDVVFDDVKVVVDNASSTFYDIRYIVIKQARISELEDME